MRHACAAKADEFLFALMQEIGAADATAAPTGVADATANSGNGGNPSGGNLAARPDSGSGGTVAEASDATQDAVVGSSQPGAPVIRQLPASSGNHTCVG